MTLARCFLALFAALLAPLVAVAQVPHARPWAAYVVVPQTRSPMPAKGGVRVTEEIGRAHV